MFSRCISLADLKPLENWNISNEKKFFHIFENCSPSQDLKVLEKWDIPYLYDLK